MKTLCAACGKDTLGKSQEKTWYVFDAESGEDEELILCSTCRKQAIKMLRRWVDNRQTRRIVAELTA